MKKNVPTLFGCPLWLGKIKRRVAKKYINRSSIGYIYRYNGGVMANIKIGDLINDCSGFNGELTEIIPYYRPLLGGDILVDIDLQTSNTGCSLTHCGISPEQPREVIEAHHVAFLEGWTLGPGGQTWYGGLDSLAYQKVAADTMKKIALIKSGGHISDGRGRRLKEFATSGSI